MNNSQNIIEINENMALNELISILKKSLFAIEFPFLKNISDAFIVDLLKLMLCFYNTNYMYKENDKAIGFIIGNIPYKSNYSDNISKLLKIIQVVIKMAFSNYKLSYRDIFQIFKQITIYFLEITLNIQLFLKFQFSSNISLFQVASTFQGKGIGTLLYEKFEHQMVIYDKKNVYVRTQSNFYYKFYEKNKFRRIKSINCFFNPDEILIYRKVVNSFDK